MRVRTQVFARIAAGTVLTCALAVPASAGQIEWPGAGGSDSPIVDHPPLNTGGGASDTSYTLDPSPLERWQQIADDFVLGESAVVRRIVWWGFYGDTFDEFPEPAPDSEQFRIRFYGARAGDGLPDDDNILFEDSFVDPMRVATGRVILTGPAPPEYVYQADFPVPLSLDENTPYWLEIVQDGNIESLFRWEVSVAEETGQAFRNLGTDDWQSSLPQLMADTAFQLLEVPEPGSGVLLALGLCALSRRTRLPKGGRMRKTKDQQEGR